MKKNGPCWFLKCPQCKICFTSISRLLLVCKFIFTFNTLNVPLAAVGLAVSVPQPAPGLGHQGDRVPDVEGDGGAGRGGVTPGHQSEVSTGLHQSEVSTGLRQSEVNTGLRQSQLTWSGPALTLRPSPHWSRARGTWCRWSLGWGPHPPCK